MTKADESPDDEAARHLLETTHRPHKPIGLTPSRTKKRKNQEQIRCLDVC